MGENMEMRVLLVEDSDADEVLFSEVVKRIAGERIYVKRAKTLAEAVEMLSRDNFEAVVADLGLPECRGVDTVRRIVEHTEAAVVVLTGEDEMSLGVKTIHAGAQDYLAKQDLSPDSLQRALRYATERRKFVSALETKNREIESALREQRILLKEVHHRVKNNMQVICSLLNMQAGRFDNGQLKEALKESHRRIAAMALVHEQLYRAEPLSQIDFARYTQALCSSLRPQDLNPNSQIELKLELDESRIPLDKALPCALILNELLTNAFRHAFPDGRSGTVRVVLTQQNRTIELIVEDNGIGLKPGLTLADLDSLGLEVVQVLSEQLDADLSLTSESGVHWKLHFNV